MKTDSTISIARYLSMFLLFWLFLFFNILTSLPVGWGGYSNPELGLIFEIPIWIFVGGLYSILSFVIIKKENPIIIFWFYY